MLIKWCKIQHLSLDKALLFPRNQVISLKNWKLWGPTTKEFNIFSEILHKFASYQCLQMGVRDFSISLRSWVIGTTQKMKFAIKDFSSKCYQIRRYLRIWSYLLEISLMENFIFWAVWETWFPGADSEILKKGVLYVGHHGWMTKKILDFRWSKTVKIMLETISFWRNTSFIIFKFSVFISNESLPMKSYHFFKIYKIFW